ncbi:D-alanyl-D-alanine carboxypeptidase family protein [Streptomyces sp. NBC_01506]|uniref:D-alanyl-D-alanine carboxypeptidase family protein n=1 Tax=Streptomyces sp. NBC_01506 TaxID=2903887 RepID=UPI0038698567
MRRTTVVALTAGALLTGSALVAPTTMAAESAPQAAAALPTLSAKGAFLLDSTTGKARYSKTGDTRRQMASTTKIMTAAVVLNTKGIDLNRKVTIKQTYRDYVAREGASTADLRTGDKVTIRQLLYGLMLPSGCDAAYALADAIGTGSTVAARTKSFISKMNAKATELGLKNTKFDSFDGISQAGNNYTTPRDLATIAQYAMKNSALRTVVKTTTIKTAATSSTGATRTYTWHNTNQLLGSYSGAFGVKTGTGTAAGPCLIFAATRNGKTHIGVILNGTDRYNDAKKLLDYYSGVSASTMKLRQLPAGAQRD